MVSNSIPWRSEHTDCFEPFWLHRTRTRNKINYYCIVWIDSIAIYLAVLVVTGVGSIIDYLKEQEFTKRTREENAGYKVSKAHQ